jgi:DDE superfamily endonuclease
VDRAGRRPPAAPGGDLGQTTAAQIRALTERLGATGKVPLFVFDAGYDPIALTVDLADVAVAVLVRIRSDRVFYTDPAARAAGQMGRPRRHGARFCCVDPASRPTPEHTSRPPTTSTAG